jgi:hypothetical protein
MARSIKEVIEVLSTLDPNASCVWQLWTKEHVADNLTDNEWESVVNYFDKNHSITSEEVGLDALITELLDKRASKGSWE